METRDANQIEMDEPVQGLGRGRWCAMTIIIHKQAVSLWLALLCYALHHFALFPLMAKPSSSPSFFVSSAS